MNVNIPRPGRVRRHRSFRRVRGTTLDSPARAAQDEPSSNDSVEVRVGRLLEVGAGGRRGEVPDVRALFQKMRRLLRARPTWERFVVIVDWRTCPLLAAEASELVLRSVTTGNPRVIRSGALLSNDPLTESFRYLGLVRDGEDDQHRVFRDDRGLTRWLGAVLRADEATRLNEFLAIRA